MIEDVQYLLENSVQGASPVFIDSAQRDLDVFPTPSEYVVHFDEPYKLVFGIEMLDATIPQTMYNVDSNNNLLPIIALACEKSAALVPLAGAGLSEAAYEDAERDIIAADMRSIGQDPVFRQWVALLDSTLSGRIVVVMESAAFAAALGARVVRRVDGDAASATQCVLVRHEVTVTMTAVPSPTPSDVSLGVGLNILAAARRGAGLGARDVTAFVYNGSTYMFATADAPELAERIVGAPGSYEVRGDATSAASQTTVVYYDACYVDGVRALVERGVANPALWPRYTMQMIPARLEPGNYDVMKLQPMVGKAVEPLLEAGGVAAAGAFSAASTSSSTVDRQNRYQLVHKASAPGTALRFILPFPKSGPSARALLGMGTPALASMNEQPLERRYYNAIALGCDAGACAPSNMAFMSVRTVDAAAGTVDATVVNVLVAPGVVNLLGVRFITLRCPEIEQYIGATGKYGAYSTGIGVFKLTGGADSINPVRFDYTTLIRKPMHPIGRLPRLTFRFEMMDGTLYDFKGINHQLFMAVNYYTPVPVGGKRPLLPSASVLNPDYNPDYLGYMIEQKRLAAHHTYDRDGYGYEGSETDADADADADTGELDEQTRQRVLLEEYIYGTSAGT